MFRDNGRFRSAEFMGPLLGYDSWGFTLGLGCDLCDEILLLLLGTRLAWICPWCNSCTKFYTLMSCITAELPVCCWLVHSILVQPDLSLQAMNLKHGKPVKWGRSGKVMGNGIERDGSRAHLEFFLHIIGINYLCCPDFWVLVILRAMVKWRSVKEVSKSGWVRFCTSGLQNYFN